MLIRFSENYFDLIICHNVLEYVNNQEEIMTQLLALLKKGGQLSLVKHNRTGALIQEAVLMDNSKIALKMFKQSSDSNLKKSCFGKINYYDIAEIEKWCRQSKAVIKKHLGIRSMYSLSQNNEIKKTDDWYNGMLKLELATAEEEPFAEMAFYHHVIIQK